MYQYGIDETFKKMTAQLGPLDSDVGQQKRLDFGRELRPIPEDLITRKGALPLGHIALRGDFE